MYLIAENMGVKSRENLLSFTPLVREIVISNEEEICQTPRIVVLVPISIILNKLKLKKNKNSCYNIKL